ncbi:MAG: cystatin-like fold lipoprotein [Clostridia bacterium]|nr:cystatin-like fold lipoprotein [Clostridia bacterium]
MNTEEKGFDIREYYLKEFSYFDGECDITFNIVDINFERKTISVAVTNRGKISVIEYDLIQDSNGDFFFNYGVETSKIEVNDFETITD